MSGVFSGCYVQALEIRLQTGLYRTRLEAMCKMQESDLRLLQSYTLKLTA